VWLDDWSATGTSTGAGAGAATATGTAAGAATATGTAAGAVTVTGAVATSGPSVVLEARAPGPAEATGIRLTLVPTKPLVLHGDRGYSRKGAEAGNASYYVSQTRLGASGAITSAGEAYAVHGTAWMDHEWSTSALGADRVGWDWFSLQLDDGSELMAFQLRAADGTTAPESAATFVAADGTATSLPGYAFTVTATDHWTSPTTGARYPAAWRIEVPSRAIDVTAKPLIADQEMDGAIRYWEGAVRIAGRHAGKVVAGFGYAELTGYASSGDGAILP
jgi:predicted secreted hydrolase